MKILCLLLFASLMALAVTAKWVTCEGKPRGKIKQFNNRVNDVAFPCKYYALKRQQCGKYLITLSPGHLWLEDNYYIDTVWLGVNDTETNQGWDGRTTNKIAVKYYNSNGTRDLFNKKRGKLFTSDIFDTGLEKKATAYIKDKNDTFKFTFTPWDPSNRGKFPHPYYTFECFNETAVYNEYPEQVCGGDKKVEDIAKDDFDIPKAHTALLIYHDVFMSDVVQTDDECIEAADIMQNLCPNDFDRRRLVLENCMEILLKPRHTECVTLFQCTPMQAFNSCIRWGCTGKGFEKSEKELCYNVGDAIDLCDNMTGAGNISDRMREANCYKEYLTVEFTATGNSTGNSTTEVEEEF